MITVLLDKVNKKTLNTLKYQGLNYLYVMHTLYSMVLV